MSMKDPSFCWTGISTLSMLLAGSVGIMIEGFLVSWVCLILRVSLGISSKWWNFDLLDGAGRILNWKAPGKSQLSSLLASDSWV